MNITQRGNPKPIIRNPGCSSLQCVSKSLFICFVDFLVRTASTRSNAKTVSQTEHIHSIGLLVSSLKTVAVRTGMAIVSHRADQDASQWIADLRMDSAGRVAGHIQGRCWSPREVYR